MRLEDLDRLRELAGIKVDEGRMSDMVIHDSETMSKEEFAKKHGKEMADEYFESAELTEGKTVSVKWYDDFDDPTTVHIGDNTLSLGPSEVNSAIRWEREGREAFSPAEMYVSDWMYKTAKNWDDVHAYLKRVRDTGDEEAIKTAVQKTFKTGSMEPKIMESVMSGEALTEEQFDEAAGEKDACYHKVKSRYKVWPSAYASGALVKCRKVGAKNWGKSKD